MDYNLYPLDYQYGICIPPVSIIQNITQTATKDYAHSMQHLRVQTKSQPSAQLLILRMMVAILSGVFCEQDPFLAQPSNWFLCISVALLGAGKSHRKIRRTRLTKFHFGKLEERHKALPNEETVTEP